MSLSIVLDSDAVALADALAASLDGPPSDSFAEDIVVVPSLGVGRWLQQRLARRDEVCARVTLEFPGRLLWRLLEALIPGLPGRSPFDPAIARWAILALLEELPAGDAFDVLRRRVAEASPAARLERAGEIAAVFDRYLAYRRDWLESWTRGGWIASAATASPHEAWQRWMWRALLEHLPGVSREHPFETFRRLLTQARVDGAAGARRLREACGIERVRLFGFTPMAPAQFELYGALGQVLDVRWYVPDPCRDFWLDVVSAREAARIAAASPENAWLYVDEPVVLGDWARAHRDFLVQLRQLEERFEVAVDEDFRERACAPPENDLQALQQSVLTRSDAPWAVLTRRAPEATEPGGEVLAQHAIEIHATHGPTRQVEVLHDRLLALFQEMPQLRPDDVVVFCTAMESFAPRVQAVFAGAPPALRIPFRISGHAREADPVVRAALEVLALAARPVGVEAVMELLANSALAQALGLDAAMVDELRGALVAAGIHGGSGPEPDGTDAACAAAPHGWRAGIERLVLGVAVSDEVGLLADRVPVRRFSDRGSEVVGRVLMLLDDIDVFRSAGPRLPVAGWVALAQRWLEARFGTVPGLREGWLTLRDALVELADTALAGAAPEIDVESFRLALSDALTRGAGSAEPSGALTVAPLGSLRGVPFRVICLLGMDDGAWPRGEAVQEYDLMHVAPRFGDRIARFDDRGIFLDAVLAARDRLLLLYCGREARDNTARQPATVLRELIRYVALQPGAGLAVREHPLQPFAPQAFLTPGADAARPPGQASAHEGASFAAQWLDAARILATPLAQRPAPRPLAEGTVEPGTADSHELAIEALVDVFAHPARLFLRQGVGAGLPFEAAQPRDDPPVAIDAGRRDVEHALRALRDGSDPQRLHQRLAHDPGYPVASLGEARATAVLQEALRLHALVEELELGLGGAGQARERVALRVDVDGVAVSGVLTSSAGGRVQLIASAYGYAARAAADAWLRHLLWQAALEQGVLARAEDAPQTLLVCGDGVWRVAPADNATQRLREVLHWWRRVRCEAMPLFPRTCWTYLKARGTPETLAAARAGDDAGVASLVALTKAHRAALGTARNVLEGAPGAPLSPEREDPWLEALWRGAPPALETILAAGLALYAPLHGCLSEFGDTVAAEQRP